MAKKQANNYQKNTAQNQDVTRKHEELSSGRLAGKAAAVAEKPSATQRKAPAEPTYEQIAERAKHLWYERGCSPGQDDKNWYDAENQLKQELGVR